MLNNYLLYYPDESCTEQVINFLNQEGCFLSNNYNGHFTASAWIVNQNMNKVLMTHHKKLNMWLQLGGHADGDSDLLKVALREAKEESGIERFKIITKQIFDLDIHIIPQNNDQPSHTHYDVRFIFEANSKKDRILISEESNDVSWVSLNGALKRNSESSIKRMVNKTNNFLININ